MGKLVPISLGYWGTPDGGSPALPKGTGFRRQLGKCAGPTIGVLPPGALAHCNPGEVLKAPPCEPPPPIRPPQRAMARVIKWAIRNGLIDTPPIYTQPPPTHAPGFRGRRFPVTDRMVLRGSSAGATAAAIFLADANNLVAADIIDVSSLANALSFTVPDGMAGVVESFQFIGPSMSPNEFLYFVVAKNGVAVNPTEFQIANSCEPIPLNVQVDAGEKISIRTRLDTQTIALYCILTMNVWIYPVKYSGTDDSEWNKIMRSNPSWAEPGECI